MFAISLVSAREASGGRGTAGCGSALGHGAPQASQSRSPGALHVHRLRVQRQAVARHPPDVQRSRALPGGELLRALPQDDGRRGAARGGAGGQLRRAELDGEPPRVGKALRVIEANW